MKRVLIVAYFFPPLSNSGTQRPLKFANFLPAFGWAPTVLTVSDPPDADFEPNLLGEVADHVEVVRAPLGSRLQAQRLARVAGPWRTRVADALEWRLRRRNQFPDLYASWLRPAVAEGLRVFRSRPFDVILATGFPWTSLLVGDRLSAETGRPWIADFRDPWSGDEVFALERPIDAKQLALERRLLHRATRIVAVNDALADHLRELAGDRCAPVSTIANGFDRGDLDHAEQPPALPPGKRRVVYTGVWKVGYNPGALYEAADRLRREHPDLAAKLQLDLAGFPAGQANTWNLTSILRERGRISHSAALGLMRSADLLFLPVAGGLHQRVQIPGKLYEYLATGRPIVAMADADGATGRLLRAIGGGVILAPGDVAQLATVLERLCRDGGDGFPRAATDKVQAFDRRNLTRQLAEVLHDADAAQAPREHREVPGE